MGFFDEWDGGWKRSFNSIASVGEEMKLYIDEQDQKFRLGTLRTVDIQGSIADDDWTVSNFRDKVNAYISPSASSRDDYRIVVCLFEDKRTEFVNYLADKFDKSPVSVVRDLNGWTYGTGIGALFECYYKNDSVALFHIKRMLQDK